MIHAVDLFCGAGGTSSGILKAARERLGRKISLTAVNHWQTAINTHSLNHPEVKHLCEPVENIHPLDHVKSGRLDLLAASCECRFHSNARGGGPCNEQSRSQPWQLIRWATDCHVQNIMMENVREFLNWGPLHRRTKRPIKSRKSEYFKAFVNALINLGYSVEHRVQVCADFGDPTTRPRLILIARKGKAVTWPEPTHGPGRPHAWLSARNHVIDWALKGKSLFNSDGKPRLCENTVKRIRGGFEMQGDKAKPFLLLLHGTSQSHIESCVRSIDQPLPTITAGGNTVMLCEPFISAYHNGPYGDQRNYSVDAPLPTQDTSNRFALIQPFVIGQQSGAKPRRVSEPLPTVATAGAIALVEPVIVQIDNNRGNGRYVRSIDRPVPTIVSKQSMLLVQPIIVKYYGNGQNAISTDDPLPTVTTADRFALIEPVALGSGLRLDILVRMLQPHELARAHSFPKGYKFTGSQRDAVKQIGNSVPVELAAAHAHAILS